MSFPHSQITILLHAQNADDILDVAGIGVQHLCGCTDLVAFLHMQGISNMCIWSAAQQFHPVQVISVSPAKAALHAVTNSLATVR